MTYGGAVTRTVHQHHARLEPPQSPLAPLHAGIVPYAAWRQRNWIEGVLGLYFWWLHFFTNGCVHTCIYLAFARKDIYPGARSEAAICLGLLFLHKASIGASLPARAANGCCERLLASGPHQPRFMTWHCAPYAQPAPRPAKSCEPTGWVLINCVAHATL